MPKKCFKLTFRRSLKIFFAEIFTVTWRFFIVIFEWGYISLIYPAIYIQSFTTDSILLFCARSHPLFITVYYSTFARSHVAKQSVYAKVAHRERTVWFSSNWNSSRCPVVILWNIYLNYPVQQSYLEYCYFLHSQCCVGHYGHPVSVRLNSNKTSTTNSKEIRYATRGQPPSVNNTIKCRNKLQNPLSLGDMLLTKHELRCYL